MMFTLEKAAREISPHESPTGDLMRNLGLSGSLGIAVLLAVDSRKALLAPTPTIAHK